MGGTVVVVNTPFRGEVNMAVVLLKIFEEANLSGELRLSGRKLRDFPKAAGKYNLSDTVIAGNLCAPSLIIT